MQGAAQPIGSNFKCLARDHDDELQYITKKKKPCWGFNDKCSIHVNPSIISHSITTLWEKNSFTTWAELCLRVQNKPRAEYKHARTHRHRFKTEGDVGWKGRVSGCLPAGSISRFIKYKAASHPAIVSLFWSLWTSSDASTKLERRQEEAFRHADLTLAERWRKRQRRRRRLPFNRSYLVRKSKHWVTPANK